MKSVFPLGSRRVKHGVLPFVIAQDHHGIIFQIKIPIRIGREAFYILKITTEVSKKIEHVDALIKKNSPLAKSQTVMPWNTPLSINMAVA